MVLLLGCGAQPGATHNSAGTRPAIDSVRIDIVSSLFGRDHEFDEAEAQAQAGGEAEQQEEQHKPKPKQELVHSAHLNHHPRRRPSEDAADATSDASPLGPSDFPDNPRLSGESPLREPYFNTRYWSRPVPPATLASWVPTSTRRSSMKWPMCWCTWCVWPTNSTSRQLRRQHTKLDTLLFA